MTDLIKNKLTERAFEVEKSLKLWLSQKCDRVEALKILENASNYAALGGGKRLRPFLLIESALMTGATIEQAMPAACAIEMVHSYSLVHDDLPAMDDADTRRGQPSVHKAFDEAIAILAGDALLTDAFYVITQGYDDPAIAAALVNSLAFAAGSAGMVGGQMMDLYPAALDERSIIGIQERKTGAIIKAAAEMGGIVGGADMAALDQLKSYASALGLAFQIVDDILDVTQTPEALGKPAGADDAAGKATFVSLLGLDGAKNKVVDLTAKACAHLEPFGEKADLLVQLADDLAHRTH